MIDSLTTWLEWLPNAWDWLTRTPTPLSWILVLLGIVILLQPQRLFQRYRKQTAVEVQPKSTDLATKYAAWMSAALNHDERDLRNSIFINHYDIDFKHLIDPDSYFEVVYQLRSSSVFTLDIGKRIEGHIFYGNSELERIPEVCKPIERLERRGHDQIILRQWVSQSMMNEVAKDGGREITFHFNAVNVWVDAKYPDGSEGPQCRMNIPSKITKTIPTRVELEG